MVVLMGGKCVGNGGGGDDADGDDEKGVQYCTLMVLIVKRVLGYRGVW